VELREWTVHHIKQKDMIARDLVSYKEEGDKVLCEYKEGRKIIFYCIENLDLSRIKTVNDNEASTFVCLCNEHNFKLLVDNWNLFKTKQNLTFIFLNPEMAEKWVIKPFIHTKIADSTTLKQGLRTMYDTCMGTSKE